MRFHTVLSYVTGNEGLLAEQRQFLLLRDNRMFLHQMNVRLVQKELVQFERKMQKKKTNTVCTKLKVPSCLSLFKSSVHQHAGWDINQGRNRERITEKE